MANNSLLFGIHAAYTLMQHTPERAIKICVAKNRLEEKNPHVDAILRLAKELDIPFEILPVKMLEKLAPNMQHQGIIIYCRALQIKTEQDLTHLINELEEKNTPPFLLVLDGVQDPHNLGACFRTAEAAGVHAIIAPKDKSVGITPTVSKVACGAAEKVPFIQVTNLARTLSFLKDAGVWVYGAEGEAKTTLFQTSLRGPIALVLGSEGTGLRTLTKERCDGLLSIPMQGILASLNVSVATGVFLFEAVRQRQSF